MYLFGIILLGHDIISDVNFENVIDTLNFFVIFLYTAGNTVLVFC